MATVRRHRAAAAAAAAAAAVGPSPSPSPSLLIGSRETFGAPLPSLLDDIDSYDLGALQRRPLAPTVASHLAGVCALRLIHKLKTDGVAQ